MLPKHRYLIPRSGSTKAHSTTHHYHTAMAEDEGTIIKSLTSVQLPMEPACLEFCPAHPEYLIIGSWHLIKDDHHDGTQAREQDEGDGPAGDHQGVSASDKQRHMGRVDLYRIQGEQV